MPVARNGKGGVRPPPGTPGCDLLYTFPAVKRGDRPVSHTFVITNDLGTPITGNSLQISAAVPGAWSLDTSQCPASLAPGQECIVTATFHPPAK